jgi:hypothetical protein
MEIIEDLKIVDIKGNLNEIDLHGSRSIRAQKATWIFDGVSREFSVKNNEQIFVPFLSHTKQELICFCKGYVEYKPPCNVIILNGDGSLRHRLCPPIPISEAFNKYESNVGSKEALSEIRFVQPEIVKLGHNELFTFWIGFDYDWYEVREFNLKTGEFGKLIRSARL